MVACSSTDEAEPTASSVADTEVTEAIASPPGDFYAPPDPLPEEPAGTLIWAEEVGGIDLNPPATVWRILYHSRSEQDRDIAVSGFALVPTAPAPEGDRAVYGWAHGTVGQGDQCAPSHEVRDNLPPYGGQQVERGAVLVATDYEGVGTPGVPTTTDGVAEGHTVLDSVRAVAALPDVGPIGDVVLAGHSQGGVAVLFAGELAPTYAPELDLVGIVALAPGGELPTLADAVDDSPYRGLVLIGASGMRAGHPDLDLSTVLTPDALADLPRVESECLDATIGRYQDDPGGVTTRPPAACPRSNASSKRTRRDRSRSRHRSSSATVTPTSRYRPRSPNASERDTAPSAPTSSAGPTPVRTTTRSSTPPPTTCSPSSPPATTTNQPRANAHKRLGRLDHDEGTTVRNRRAMLVVAGCGAMTEVRRPRTPRRRR